LDIKELESKGKNSHEKHERHEKENINLFCKCCKLCPYVRVLDQFVVFSCSRRTWALVSGSVFYLLFIPMMVGILIKKMKRKK